MILDTYKTEDVTYYITDSIDFPGQADKYVVITENTISCPTMRCDECILKPAYRCKNMASVSSVIKQYFPTFCKNYPELLI